MRLQRKRRTLCCGRASTLPALVLASKLDLGSAHAGEAALGVCKMLPPTLDRLGHRALPPELSRADPQKLKGATMSLRVDSRGGLLAAANTRVQIRKGRLVSGDEEIALDPRTRMQGRFTTSWRIRRRGRD